MQLKLEVFEFFILGGECLDLGFKESDLIGQLSVVFLEHFEMVDGKRKLPVLRLLLSQV